MLTQPAEIGGRAPVAPAPLSRLAEEGGGALDLMVEMAHDLRSPLTSIVVLADLLRSAQSGPVTELQRHQLGLIYTAALSLCGTASDVMELAQGGDLLKNRAPTGFTPAEIFTEIQDIVRPMTEVKGLTLQFELPELGRRTGYPQAVSRVLLNLATNAVKYTETGFVRIAARNLGDNRVEFSVRDTGPGLDLDALNRIYEPIRIGPGAGPHRFSSSGLGLAICRRLVAAMGSELQIDTQPDWGTLFYFSVELPLAE